MIRYTDRAWWTVEDAAQLLRVHRETLYDACASGDFPHIRVGRYIKIPAEALLLTPRPDPALETAKVRDEHAGQLAFEFDVPIIPVRRYRNTGEQVRIGDYETRLSKKKWRNPSQAV